MNRIPKKKRNQFILAVLMTLMIVVGLWYGLIRYQQDKLRSLEDKKKLAEDKVSQIQDLIKNSRQIEADLLVVSNKLDNEEEDMASGDLYASMVNSIRAFKLPYKIDVVQFNSAGAAVNVNLLPAFPYKQATISISGTAHYYDLGSFVADFENRIPFSRVLNLELTPTSASGPDEKEKLAFRMDIVSLVKPGGAHPVSNP